MMNCVRLLLLFTKELIVSAVKVAWLAVQPNLKLRPAFVNYPLTVTSDGQIALLANLITLTPGTLSVDVSDDKRTLLIHVIDMADADDLIGGIAAGFETHVLRVLRCSSGQPTSHSLLWGWLPPR